MTTLNEFGLRSFGIIDELGRYIGTPSYLDERAHRIFISVLTVTVADEIVNSAVIVSESKTEIFDSSESTDIYVSQPNVSQFDVVTTSKVIKTLATVVEPDYVGSLYLLTTKTQLHPISNIKTSFIDLRKLLMLKVVSDVSVSYDIWKIIVQSLEDYISALELILILTTRAVTEYLGLQTTISKSVSTSPLDEVVSTYHTIESLLKRVYTYLMAKVITQKLTVILVPEDDVFFIKKGDTGPILKCKIVDQDGNEKSFPISTVTFTLRDMSKTVKFSKPGEWVRNRLEYVWESTDTANLVEGIYLGEFDCTLDEGTKITIPNDGFIKIKVVG